MSSPFLTHARLDRCLARLARRPERFAQDALRRCAALDARGCDLEITDPDTWREATGSLRVTLENQLGKEIHGLRKLGREEELRLALRIEFARLRLERALQRHGLQPEDRNGGAALPPTVARRKQEWHALRLELVERNLYLVLIHVERYRHTRAERADLIQAAGATLFRAVDGFDWRRRVLFRTYAVHWLNQGFRSHLYDTSNTVRVPVYVQKSTKHIDAAIQRLGRPRASIEEIAQESGLTPATIASALRSGRKMRSLDSALDEFGGKRSLASELALPDDGGPYSNAMEDVSIESGVDKALARLSQRERRVVELRFGIGCERAHIYSEIATELGVSLERVRQILVRAITKLRAPELHRLLQPLIG
jgi:RNA polymerase sigma factor (sigma-70 family)